MDVAILRYVKYRERFQNRRGRESGIESSILNFQCLTLLHDNTTAFGRATLKGFAVPASRYPAGEKPGILGVGIGVAIGIGIRSHAESVNLKTEIKQEPIAIAIPTPIPTPTPRVLGFRPAVRGRPKPRFLGVVDCFHHFSPFPVSIWKILFNLFAERDVYMDGFCVAIHGNAGFVAARECAQQISALFNRLYRQRHLQQRRRRA